MNCYLFSMLSALCIIILCSLTWYEYYLPLTMSPKLVLLHLLESCIPLGVFFSNTKRGWLLLSITLIYWTIKCTSFSFYGSLWSKSRCAKFLYGFPFYNASSIILHHLQSSHIKLNSSFLHGSSYDLLNFLTSFLGFCQRESCLIALWFTLDCASKHTFLVSSFFIISFSTSHSSLWRKLLSWYKKFKDETLVKIHLYVKNMKLALRCNENICHHIYVWFLLKELFIFSIMDG